MGVTQLNELVRFLNLTSDEDLGRVAALRANPLSFEDDDFKVRRRDIQLGKRVQQEIRRDLLPIISPEKRLSQSDAYKRIAALVNKINRLKLLPLWGVRAVNTPYPEDAKETLETLGPGQKASTLFGRTWVINTKVSIMGGIQARSGLRKYMYWQIIAALERGEFARLRKCPQCPTMFVAEDPRQKYCGEQCKLERDVKDASKRMKLSRERRRLAPHEKRAIEHFSQFVRLAARKLRKRKLNAQELTTLRSVLEALGRGNVRRGGQLVRESIMSKIEGAPELEIWKALPNRVRAVFRAL